MILVIISYYHKTYCYYYHIINDKIDTNDFEYNITYLFILFSLLMEKKIMC